MHHNISRLTELLEGALVNKETAVRSSAIAIANDGREYEGFSIASDTHLLSIPAEQVALLRAVQDNNPAVKHINALSGAPTNEAFSPITAKIIADHARRTGIPIGYTLTTPDNVTVCDVPDIQELLPHYTPVPLSEPILLLHDKPLPQLSGTWDPSGDNPIEVLTRYAQNGAEAAFMTSSSGTRYGAAVLTKDGRVFASGQYSSFDERTGIHAEMAALIAALTTRDVSMTHIGVLSTKDTDEPCRMCGFCRQFIAELCARYNGSPEIINLSYDGSVHQTYSLAEYLPDSWLRKK